VGYVETVQLRVDPLLMVDTSGGHLFDTSDVGERAYEYVVTEQCICCVYNGDMERKCNRRTLCIVDCLLSVVG
jgi:hypothetical protein